MRLARKIKLSQYSTCAKDKAMLASGLFALSIGEERREVVSHSTFQEGVGALLEVDFCPGSLGQQ